jgi:hypothetical protein
LNCRFSSTSAHFPQFLLPIFNQPSAIINSMKLALRQLAKTPGFTIVAILTLGTGLAVAIVVFAFFQATVLRPLRVAAAGRFLAAVRTTHGCRTGLRRGGRRAADGFHDPRRRRTSFRRRRTRHGQPALRSRRATGDRPDVHR